MTQIGGWNGLTTSGQELLDALSNSFAKPNGRSKDVYTHFKGDISFAMGNLIAKRTDVSSVATPSQYLAGQK